VARTRLTREDVLRAGIRLADEGGIESLSIRMLAQELGLRPMSLYHYVPSRDALLTGMLQLVVTEMKPASRGGDWRRAVRRSAVSANEVLMRHPWASTLMMDPARVSASRMAYMEALLRRLRGAGLSAETTDHAYHALDSHIIGFALWHTGYSTAIRNTPNLDATFFVEVLRDYPFLAEHAQQHDQQRRPGEPSDFEFGLDLILDSLERRLAPDAGVVSGEPRGVPRAS
jgi:AcrR family transcriptional regulator